MAETRRLDPLKLAALAAYAALTAAWLAALPLWLWSHGRHHAAALPWLVNAAVLLLLAWCALGDGRNGGLAGTRPAPAAAPIAS